LAAVDGHYFLPSDRNADRQPGRSASELYEVLAQEQSLAPMHHFMKRNFAAALQDESQQAINAYLRADPAELAARWNDDIDRYKSNPVYLAKAASLLGEGHILHKQLLAKQYYFEGLIKRLEGGKTGDTLLLKEALALENMAIQQDSGAAYVYNEVGLIYDEIRKVYKAAGNEGKNSEYSQKQLDSYKVAMGLAPKWVMPVYNSATTYLEWRRFNEAEHLAVKVISLDSNFIDNVYNDLGVAYYFSKQYEKSIEANLELMRLRPLETLNCSYNIATLKALLNRPNEAIFWLEKAIQKGAKYERIQQDGDLDNIRNTIEFESMMKYYFSEKKN
jgi:hypothetical protein